MNLDSQQIFDNSKFVLFTKGLPKPRCPKTSFNIYRIQNYIKNFVESREYLNKGTWCDECYVVTEDSNKDLGVLQKA